MGLAEILVTAALGTLGLTLVMVIAWRRWEGMNSWD